MNSLIAKLLSGIIGIGISAYLLKPGVTYDGNFTTILLVGLVVGLLMFFVRPILSLITLPIRIITLNLFSIVIMMFLVWLVDALFFPFDVFEINGINNLFFTTLIIWGTEKVSSIAFK
ncbi:MAG: phage holin family protein [Candidatus Paceibacterota bacterium]|jgi:putative membrane protein